MYKKREFEKEYYRPIDIARLVGVTSKTIQERLKNGDIGFKLTDSGRRVIPKEDLFDYLNRLGLLEEDEDTRVDIIYARVSSNEQKQKGDLDRQALSVIEGAREIKDPIIIKEVGSGLNDRRKGLLRLIGMVGRGEVRYVYVRHKDRLTRFGFNMLEKAFKTQGTEIRVLEEEECGESLEKELVEDMISIVSSFSGRLYGMRSGENRRKEKDA